MSEEFALFIFFYLSSSTEKERSSSSSATHVVSVRALHDPQQTNINRYQQKLLKVAATRKKFCHSTNKQNTYQWNANVNVMHEEILLGWWKQNQPMCTVSFINRHNSERKTGHNSKYEHREALSTDMVQIVWDISCFVRFFLKGAAVQKYSGKHVTRVRCNCFTLYCISLLLAKLTLELLAPQWTGSTVCMKWDLWSKRDGTRSLGTDRVQFEDRGHTTGLNYRHGQWLWDIRTQQAGEKGNNEASEQQNRVCHEFIKLEINC